MQDAWTPTLVDNALRLLTSIDISLQRLTTQGSVTKRAADVPTTAKVATAADLDSTYGDEPVKFNPKFWSGDSCKGKTMSECPPDFLDMLAESFGYFAGLSEAAGTKTTSGKPKADYERRSERRARGWAARMRAGWTPPPQEAPPAWATAPPEPLGDWTGDAPRF